MAERGSANDPRPDALPGGAAVRTLRRPRRAVLRSPVLPPRELRFPTPNARLAEIPPETGARDSLCKWRAIPQL